MCTRCVFLGGLTALMAAPAVAAGAKGDPQLLEIAMPAQRRIGWNAWMGQLSPNVWVYTSTHLVDGLGYYPANGAIVVHGDEALLIDTGWNDADAQVILDAWDRLGKARITRALVTHFHRDRVGGIGALAKRGIPAFGNPLTIGLAIDAGLPAPKPLHEVEKRKVHFGGVEVYYPGAGHTVDNIVAWIPRDGIIFGGCLVKSTTEPDLGNVTDGDISAYPKTLARVARTYPKARHVIPGHGTFRGDALAHTLALASAANRR
jgi:metallo-beta-lactamase class B